MGDADGSVIRLHDGVVDLATGLVDGSRAARLTPRELALFAYLSARPRKDISRGELLASVWGLEPDSRSRTLYSTMERLRRKVEREPATPEHLLSVGKRGYRFEPPALAPDVDRVPRPIEGHRPCLDVFVGRERECAEIRSWLSSPPSQMLVVSGAVGVGKSRLVWEAVAGAHLAPGRVLWVDVGEDRVEHRLAAQLGVSAGAPRLTERLARIVSSEGLGVLIFDGVQAPESLGWLPPTAVHVIAISGVEHPDGLVVQPFSAEGGRDLLIARIRSKWPRWVPDAEVAARLEDISAAVGGLPLALELCAPSLLVVPPALVLEHLAATTQDGLRSSLAFAVRSLDDGGRAALGLVALVPRRATFDLACAVVGPDALFVLSPLVERGLLAVTDDEGGRHLELSPAVRAFMMEEGEISPGLSEAALRRHAAFLAPLGSPEAIETRTIGAGAAEYADLRQLLEHLLFAASRGGLDGASCGRAAAMVLDFDGDFRRAGCVLKAALNATKASPVGMVIWMERNLAECERREGHIEASRARLTALIGLAETRCLGRLGAVLHTLGILEETHGSSELADDLYQRALVQHRAVGDRFRVGLTLGQQATLALLRGKSEQAISLFGTCLAEIRGLGSPLSEAIYQGNMAVALMNAHRFEDALRMLTVTAALCRELQARRMEVGNLSNLGLLHHEMGSLEKARKAFEIAQRRARPLGDEMEEAVSQGGLAEVLLEGGDLLAARRLIDRCAPVIERFELTYNMVALAITQAKLCRLEGRMTDAKTHLANAASGLETGGVDEHRPRWLLESATHAAASQDRAQATEYLRIWSELPGLRPTVGREAREARALHQALGLTEAGF